MVRPTALRSLAVLWLVGVLTACGATGASAPAGSPQASSRSAAAPSGLKPLTLQLGYIVSGYTTPFILAKEKGYYAQAGLNVNIVQGRGLAAVIGQVEKNDQTVGETGVESLPLAINKGAPIKAVAVYVHKTPMSFIYHSSMTLTTPTDLAGHTIYSFSGDIDNEILPVVLAKAGMTVKQVKLRLVQPSTYPALFAKDPRAVVIGFANDDYENIKSVSPGARDKLYSDFGVQLQDVGIIASDSMIQNAPDVIRAFLAASAKGWAAAVADPQAAAAAAVKEFPQANAGRLVAEFKATLPLLWTPATQGHPYGWMAEADWKQQVSVLQSAHLIQAAKSLSDYYTNEFVPQS